jgi:hypothetical protein
VKEGDIITAVNGKSVLEARDIADLLLNQADKQVLLQVKRKAETRAVIVLPVTMAKQRRCATAMGAVARARWKLHPRGASATCTCARWDRMISPRLPATFTPT